MIPTLSLHTLHILFVFGRQLSRSVLHNLCPDNLLHEYITMSQAVVTSLKDEACDSNDIQIQIKTLSNLHSSIASMPSFSDTQNILDHVNISRVLCLTDVLIDLWDELLVVLGNQVELKQWAELSYEVFDFVEAIPEIILYCPNDIHPKSDVLERLHHIIHLHPIFRSISHHVALLDTKWEKIGGVAGNDGEDNNRPNETNRKE